MQNSDLNFLKKIIIEIFVHNLFEGNVLTEDVEAYNVDWMNTVRGQTK